MSLDASRNLFVRNLPKLKRTRRSFWIDWHNPRDRIKPWYVAVNTSFAQPNRLDAAAIDRHGILCILQTSLKNYFS